MQIKGGHIKDLFEPKSIAIVGVSNKKSKIGYKILYNVISGGYEGNIYPVNPKGGFILKKKVFKSIKDVPEKVDLATIVVSAKYVFPVVKECVDHGVKNVSIITSGFSEIGNVTLENEIADYAQKRGIRILGPNIFGIYSAQSSLNATFGPDCILPGKVAIITQSGALGLSMIGKTSVENIGLSAIVSVGNKSDIDEADLLEYLVKHDKTKIILMYIEGVCDGETLIRSLKKATKIKPVVVIKSGSSKRGAIAAASHTGSLAGSDKIFQEIMEQCGVLRAESIKDAFNWCKFLSQSSYPQGDKCVIITNGGGIGVMATDACEKFGISLYDDKEMLHTIFKDVTPDFGSTKNPIDLTGQATSKDYNLALEAALKNDNIHSVIALYCETAVFDADNLSHMIEENSKKFLKRKKPILFSIFGGEKTELCLNKLKKKHVPVFSDVYESVKSLGSLYKHNEYIIEKKEAFKKNKFQSGSSDVDILHFKNKYNLDLSKINTIIARIKADNRTFLLSNEAQELMKACNITVPSILIARTLDEAILASEKIGYPVVMKILSRDIIHKSDAGGVALNLENKAEVIDAYQAIMYRARQYNPHAHIDGIEVTEMVKKSTETIIGARRDSIFGPIVMFGLGGIYVEIMKDVSFRSFPLNTKDAMAMVKGIKSYPLLLGVRGEKKKDIPSVLDTILKLGALVYCCPDISDIEINPLVVFKDGKGSKAVDVRVLLSSSNNGDKNE